ncbi:Bifunctional solanapyrone synthase [Colletotrichum tanaceti]|uniref:Bifunctional solanapyrone synthase n=1 Tax=Colletotrichum tanaceti TaxID=1306861 RepID=A0A4U6X5U9_9PEZI|nr:Bifunctional solanapyrone synthase [Colletotrichum tanaceti]TKW50788.1 Bifunctional solanapyrone synthase [Colletotrichum tanaceti]
MVSKALGCALGWSLGLVPLVSALPEKTDGSPLLGSKPVGIFITVPRLRRFVSAPTRSLISVFLQCRLLADAGLGSQLFFQGDGEYTKTLETYYGGESKDLRPHCILKPETVEQVTTAIKTLNTPQAGKCWNVAIRAGGHSNFPASNTASGVTIDLVRLNTLNLNPRGVMVAGGRESTVGVSGLLLGGGSIGFAVDNAAAFEVVLANGSVVRAAGDENPDLFRALKGGGGNFGLVTKYELRHFPSHNIFGGITIFPYAQKDAVMRKFVEMVDGNANGHPDDSGFAAAAWGPAGGKIMSFIVANTEGRSNTTAFAGLGDLSPLVDMRADLPVTGIAAQITSTSGR